MLEKLSHRINMEGYPYQRPRLSKYGVHNTSKYSDYRKKLCNALKECNIPTKDYESNEKLASIRAENMKYDLQNYFDANATFNGLVKVVIVTSIVDGPEYTNDARNKAKYKPYQFVGLKTE